MFVSVHARARLKEQATALRPPRQRLPNPFRVVGKLTASFRPPPPLLHPLDSMSLFGRLAVQAREGGIQGTSHGVRATERRMQQSCGCYSASPCPLDTGLVRLIVYSAFRATPNASRSAAIHFSFPFFGGGSFFRLQDQKRVWIAGFS